MTLLDAAIRVPTVLSLSFAECARADTFGFVVVAARDGCVSEKRLRPVVAALPE
jgi:hypothetical protein